ncbi:MAG: hypothetical protein AAF085_09445, partial [Planctomycetota bacterium]
MNDGRQELKLPAGVLLTGLLFLSIYFVLAWLYQQTFHSVFEGAIDWNSEEGQSLIRGTAYVTTAYWGFGALWLAAWRVWTRHPFYRPAYRLWLRSTPWQPGAPLPKGSPMPGWAEAILIGIAVSCLAWVLPWLTIAWLIAGYVIAFALFVAGPYLTYLQEEEGYPFFAVLALAGLFVLFHESPWVIASTAAAIFAITCYALHGSLNGMPHYTKKPIDFSDESIQIGPMHLNLSGVEPTPIDTPMTRGQAAIISLLVASWIGIAQHVIEATAEGLLLTCAFIAVAPFVRLMYYTNGYRAPITVAQRIKQR